MTRLIQVFEHQKLTIRDGLSKSILDRLYQFNDQNENKYFTGIRDGVKFADYVGVIQIGGLTIEILPKADKNAEGDKELWHNVLLKMLSYCRKISLETVSEANLKKRHHSILDLYYDRFLSEIEKLLHKGLVKKYRFKSDNVNALKGQLQFAKHLQKNLIHKEHFYTRHQTYDTEHLMNQVLLRALNILSSIVSHSALVGRIRSLQLLFPEIKEIKITSSQLQKLKFNRKTEDYKEAIQIAKMIILNYSPDLKGGNENMIALLFNMNNLWEEYIYRMLIRTKQDEFTIESQKKMDFWETKTIRPDILLKRKGDKGRMIIDTKWKVINNSKPSDDDLKQIYTYNQYWNATHSMLLYPMVNEEYKEAWGKYHIGKNGVSYCKLGFINVIKDNHLDIDIGIKILNKFKGIEIM